MSLPEIKERIHQLLDTDDEHYLARVLEYAEARKDDGRLLPHETPAFLAELEQIADDMESGKEPTYTREQMAEKRLAKQAI